MALIKCPECGKEVSNKAKSCISCGYPLVDSVTDKKAVRILIAVVAVCAIISLCVIASFVFNSMENNKNVQSDVSSEVYNTDNKEFEEGTKNEGYTPKVESETNSENFNTSTEDANEVMPSEEEYTKFICDYYNKNLRPDLGYFTYCLEKHAYQYHLGTGFIDAYKFLSMGDTFTSYKAFQGFQPVFETMKQKSLEWSNELEYSYWPRLVIEVWSPGDEEILLICSSGEVDYCAYFSFDLLT